MQEVEVDGNGKLQFLVSKVEEVVAGSVLAVHQQYWYRVVAG